MGCVLLPGVLGTQWSCGALCQGPSVRPGVPGFVPLWCPRSWDFQLAWCPGYLLFLWCPELDNFCSTQYPGELCHLWCCGVVASGQSVSWGLAPPVVPCVSGLVCVRERERAGGGERECALLWLWVFLEHFEIMLFGVKNM